ncbi:putative membrane protein [Synechococcus sp. PCC 7502]|uniref:DUF1361 domain-containing protein n=1 Tax=Synechococcus sp. PCC 7502 TaxID=1173263 RepID=UPI00029FB5C2|nr:DUF1361 domain-containing protein [Synechococcus sp. PCC 7502]AFY74708.1 putative membrane protein [Synechococcus sp. PCC 7502]
MSTAWELFTTNLGWMGWNLFLAFLPLALSLVLFKHNSKNWSNHRHNLIWWLGVGAFLAFLPNAAYILTDIIHLVDNLEEPISRSGLLLLILPQYSCFFVAGFLCYVFSLQRLSDYLKSLNLISTGIWFELGIHLLSAVGVYLGRFNRLNSWNIVTKPIALVRIVLDNLDSQHFVGFTLLFFVVITCLYYLCKRLSILFLGSSRV